MVYDLQVKDGAEVRTWTAHDSHTYDNPVVSVPDSLILVEASRVCELGRPYLISVRIYLLCTVRYLLHKQI